MLLDLYMPDMSGFEVLSRLRADPATRDLPVVVLTAEDELVSISEQQLQGVDVYSKNALDEAQLLTGVQAMLGHNGNADSVNNGDSAE